MSDNVILRTAQLQDGELLLQWRNHESTRRSSLNTHVISHQEHFTWLQRTLNNPTRSLFIAEIEGDSVGMGRADQTGEGVYLLSWTVNPKHRGHGYGTKIVRELVHLFKSCQAQIKEDNTPSLKIAQSLGFELVKQEGDVLHFQIGL